MQLFILDNNLAACLLAPEHSPSGFLENFDKDLGRSISTFGQAVFRLHLISSEISTET